MKPICGAEDMGIGDSKINNNGLKKRPGVWLCPGNSVGLVSMSHCTPAQKGSHHQPTMNGLEQGPRGQDREASPHPVRAPLGMSVFLSALLGTEVPTSSAVETPSRDLGPGLSGWTLPPAPQSDRAG